MAVAILFQSSPNPKVGRYNRLIDKYATRKQFQSSPNPKVGRYRWPKSWPGVVVLLFQSSPNPKVGRY